MAEDLEEDFEEGEGSDETEHRPPSKSGGMKKLLLFVVLPLLLVVGGAAGAYFSGAADPLFKMFSGGGDSHKAEGHEEPAAAAHSGPAIFYDLPEMLVNLNSPGRKQTFLKIRVALELSDPLDVQRIEQVMPRIVDNFQVHLRELRVEDLQGAAGLYRLREQLLERVKAAAKPAKIQDVLFKEMLVQ